MNLKFTLAAQNDESLREEIRKIITTETRRVLTEELSDIIKTEVVKLRLTDPDSPTVNGMIKHHIGDRLDAHIADQANATTIKRELQAQIANAVGPAVREIKNMVAEKIMGNLKA